MGAQAAAQNDLFLQGHWEKKDAAGHVRAIKLTQSKKRKNDRKKG